MVPVENKTKEKERKSGKSSYTFKMRAGTNMLCFELRQEHLKDMQKTHSLPFQPPSELSPACLSATRAAQRIT